MTRGELNILIQNPEQISAGDLNGIEELIHKFPYCQTFHILKTKGMHTTQSIGYAEQLKRTAITVSDRKKLYEIILRQSLLKQIRETEKTVEIEHKTEEPKVENTSAAIVETAEIKTAIPEEKSIVADTEIEKKPEVVAENKSAETVIEKTGIKDSAFADTVGKSIPFRIEPTKIQAEKVESTEEKIQSVKISGLEQEILYEAINSSIQEEVWNDIKVENPGVEKPTSDEVRIKPKTDPNAPKDFHGWLHLNDEILVTPVSKIEEKTVEKENDQHLIPKGQVKNLDELIDKFIKNDPKISPAKADFYSPTNIAKLSLVDKEEFVSETLAKIYEKQGYFDKAISVYRKLSLKFPEKSSYFASLVEKTELQKAIEKQKKQK